MDTSAIRAFLNGQAPELLEHFESGVIVSDVTLKTLEWDLIRSGGKRAQVRNDLLSLGLDMIDFCERHLESVGVTLQAVPGLDVESALAAALARGCKFTLLTANPLLAGVPKEICLVQLVGAAPVAPSSPEKPVVVQSEAGVQT